MSPVPPGTAELVAHIFQPSLPGLFLFWFNVHPGLNVLGYFHAVPSGLGGRVGYVKARQKVGIERKAKNSRCNLHRSSSTEATCFPFGQ